MKSELTKINKLVIITWIGLLTACGYPMGKNENTSPEEATTDSQTEIVLASDIEWSPLNPARGDKSPQAGTIWGDRNGSGPTGFLVKFADGFSSPPHIHNVTYRGVVISGQIHNDDPEAAEMWMPAGSFWTQPAGEGHITSARGNINMAYIEIESGPYLVHPTEEAFDNGEKPVNVEQSNIVWLDAANLNWVDADKKTILGPKVAFLWGEPQENELFGTLVKLPAGFKGKILSNAASFRAVVIQGSPVYHSSNVESESKTLETGSSFSSKGNAVHRVSNPGEKESLIYIRANAKYEFISEP
ncbi:DUF4437 domain-containing protein [Flexithrix dorotheae]|uniref:DUF4437 domain-containing protein n=1 Tax=Flexithrix dorotheae TaxID=70993 RepID=UPI000374E9F1|nr:DUF4437 domain-containing protein [Flexithrix dorotheae]